MTVRNFAEENPPVRSVVGHIEHTLDVSYNCRPPAGLDELIDAAHRADAAGVIERFCTEYPLATVLVTSRSVGQGCCSAWLTRWTGSISGPFGP
ncbi:hypothetical protein [Actinomadura parmotrematis]|uniref:Uncharacterized protein n=1 Tax=Actinomadura parmotrematis TaxID=2864039 RepID=A0ABS7FSW1_9ACTN|nr:hypothetical protein [Actinomadura parmotrematis]MBW8483494.1 hypothetical protein [Actinomadura parmotrematis]